MGIRQTNAKSWIAYNTKDNDVVAFYGTTREMSKFLGIDEASLYCYSSRLKKNSKLVIGRKYRVLEDVYD